MRPKFTARASNLFGIRGCGRRIMELLEERRSGLTITDLLKLTKRSERSIRKHIKRLKELNLIKTVETKTENNRRAHLYVSSSPDEVILSLKRLLG
ncbi:MAG: HTH domain-containing protein [Candidatus Hadarchaeales archaeon]